jgi:Flp pilus assembly pilin Flp
MGKAGLARRTTGRPLRAAAVRGRALGATLTQLAADRRGVSAVEFALLAPVFLSMMIGVIEFGRVAYTQGVVSFAAEEATRYAVVNYSIDEGEVRDVARACLLGIDPDRIDAIIVTGPVDPVDNTRAISVDVSYTFEFLLPFLPEGAIPIHGRSRGFIIPPPLGAAPTVTGTVIGCGRG